MFEKPMNVCWLEIPPPWAKAISDGSLQVGANLPTKDGRRMGNAHIVDIMRAIDPAFKDAFQIITDAGNRTVMTYEEIREFFYPPQWIADPREIMEKFDRSWPQLKVDM